MLFVLLSAVLAASPSSSAIAGRSSGSATTVGSSALPVDGRITSPFGWRKTDCLFHPGVDIAAVVGTPIKAPADGEVFFSGNTREAIGMAIVIKHEGGFSTVYGHLSRLMVGRGAKVLKGEVIGLTGVSGNARGPHLHFELHWNGRARNPLTWLHQLVDAAESPLQDSGAFSPSP